jgi:hypothetical protein
MKFVVGLFLLALVSCSPSDDKAVATRSVEEFHRRFNNSAFSEIYDNAEPGLRTLMPKEAFLASMKAMREGQGAVLESEEIGIAYNHSSEGNMVKVLHEVTYEKGKAKEEFIWTVENGRGRLRSFRFIPQ